MICDEVKRVIYFFLDGALGQRKKDDFSAHLSLCPDCAERTTVQTRLRNFVRKRLSRRDATPQLRLRLERSLRAFRSE